MDAGSAAEDGDRRRAAIHDPNQLSFTLNCVALQNNTDPAGLIQLWTVSETY